MLSALFSLAETHIYSKDTKEMQVNLKQPDSRRNMNILRSAAQMDWIT